MGLYCVDIEATGLLHQLKKQENPKLHNFGAICPKTGEKVLFSRSKGNLDKLQSWLDEGHILVIHNGYTYDSEALRFFGYTVNNEIIDTLALSWYLHPKRQRHGLEPWGEELGVPKPPVYDWINEKPEVYDHRVMEDCEIQVRLWKKFNAELNNIYDTFEGKKRLLDYLMFKMELQRIQQIYKWKLDKPKATNLQIELEDLIEQRMINLSESMPMVPIYQKKKRPAKPFLKSGALSVTGQRWKDLCDEHNIDFDSEEEHKVQVGFKDPNPNSSQQIKEWLFSLGWKPTEFEYVREDDGNQRKIPQINIKNSGGKVCKDIRRLIKENPELGLDSLEGLGILNHRLSIVKGFLKNVDEDGYIQAGCNGFTNTLRLKHSILVNLPSTRVPWGKEIRSLLCTPDGYKNIGSDLSSLEDRCKHHFQWKFDPDYVKMQMADDFDPHLTVAQMGGLMTAEQVAEHKSGDKDWSHVRHLGKGGNYACQYGAGIEALMRQLNVDYKTAKAVFDGYWKLNWSIKAISKSTTVKHANGLMWQYNPIAGIWYWLKADKDRFSTLCQGLGAYIFDMWCKGINDECLKRYGKCAPFAAQFHDETVLIVKDNTFHIWEDILKTVIKKLGGELKLNRDLDCDVQEGDNYSEIH